MLFSCNLLYDHFIARENKSKAHRISDQTSLCVWVCGCVGVCGDARVWGVGVCVSER